MKLLERVLNIRSAEFSRVLVLSLGWASVVGFTIAGKAARDAIFLSRYDRSYLPLMVVAVALVSIAAVAIMTSLSKRLKSRQILALAGVVVAISLFLLQSRLAGWLVPAFYVWIDLANMIFGLQFWLLAGEIFDSRQGKRVFGLIAAGGSVAAIVVGSSMKTFVNHFGSSGLLPLIASFAAMITVIALVAGNFPPIPQLPRARRRQSVQSGKPDRYAMAIATVICAAAIAGTLVDYQFKIGAAREFRSESDLVGFFGMFSAVAGLSSALFQILFTGRILARWGIIAGLSFLPLGLAAGSSIILLSPFFAAVVFAKFADQTLRFTVHNSGIECLWLPVPIEQRQRLKPWITGTIKSSAEGLSGLAIFFVVKAVSLSVLSLLALAACAVWLWTLVRLRDLYSRTLERALTTRAIEQGQLTLDAEDATVIQTLSRALTGGDLAEQIFALELMANMDLGHWESSLRQLLGTGAPEVRKKIFEIAADDIRTIPDLLVMEEIAARGPAAEEAIRAASRRSLTEGAPVLAGCLNHSSPNLRAAAAGALYRMALHQEAAKDTLLGMLHGKAAERICAIHELADLPELMPDEEVTACLTDASPVMREAGLGVATRRRSPDFVPLVLNCLVDKRTTIAARDALLHFPADIVLRQVAASLGEDRVALEARVAQIRVLRYLPPVEAAGILCTQLDAQDPQVRGHVPNSLLMVCRLAPPTHDVLKQTEAHETDWIRGAYSASESLRLLPASDDAILLNDHFTNSFRQSVSGLFELLVVRRPGVPVEACLEIVFSGDRTRLPFVLDLLDSFLPGPVRARIEPLLEASPGERAGAARQFFPDLPSTLDEVLEGGVRSPQDWKRAIALDYAMRQERLREYRGAWEREGLGPITADVVARGRNAPEGGRSMFSTLEKTIILKSSTLFSTITAESLARVAQVADEVDCPSGTIVFRDGDPGDAVYIVAAGSVTMSVSNLELGVLRRGEPFGVLGALKNEGHRGEVRAAEDSVLLKVEREDLFMLMQGDTEIMKGIIGLLADRVVKLGELFLGWQPAASGACPRDEIAQERK